MKPELLETLLSRSTQVEIRTQSKKESNHFLKERLEQLVLDGNNQSKEAKFIRLILERKSKKSEMA